MFPKSLFKSYLNELILKRWCYFAWFLWGLGSFGCMINTLSGVCMTSGKRPMHWMFQFSKKETALIVIIMCKIFRDSGLAIIDQNGHHSVLCYLVVETPRHSHLIIAVSQLFCFLLTRFLVPNIINNQSEHQSILFLDSFSPEAQW